MTLVSHSRRFIFLRTRKTASTSIEYALLPHLGPHDWISTSVEAEPIDHPWWRTTNRTTRLPGEPALKAVLARLGVRPLRIYKHERAEGVRAAVGEDVWNSYLKIAVERHPYDRVISMWQWRIRQRDNPPTLSRFINHLERVKRAGKQWHRGGPKWQLYSNWPIYTIDNRVVANQVIRWEDLATELPQLLKQVGISDVTLGRYKSEFRDPEATPEALLKRKMRARIRDLYRDEFDTFGYEP